jgi:hypothetical protein
MEWLSKIAPGYGPDGSPLLSVLCKRTYVFANGLAAERDRKEQLAFHEKDEFLDDGDPLRDPPRAEAETIAYKPLTDVLLHACAHAPKGNRAQFLDVGIMIGGYRKMARVFGNRKVIVGTAGFRFSDPEPFDAMRLDYGKAYGGKDERSFPGVPLQYPRNPIGKGFVLKDDPALLQGLALPNIENPHDLLTTARLVVESYESWLRQPEPIAFGYVPRGSIPRLNQAGLAKPDHVDAEAGRLAALENREEVGAAGQAEPAAAMPFLNPEFFNAAPPGLKLPYLRGDETLKLRYLDPAYPAFEFRLNPEKPRIFLDVGQGRQELPATLQTLEIFKEANQYTVVWRGSAKYQGPDSLRRFKKFEFGARD